MNELNFTISDLIAGYVTTFDGGETFGIRTTDNRQFSVTLTPTLNAEFVRNQGEEFQNATNRIKELLVEGRYLFVYGTFYPSRGGQNTFEAQHIVFLGGKPEEYRFEDQNWWIDQIRRLADYYMETAFGNGPIDYANFRNVPAIYGYVNTTTNNVNATNGNGKTSGKEIKTNGKANTNGNAIVDANRVNEIASIRQDIDTISRLVYGFASAYLMTGEDRYLEAAEKGTEYLRNNFRFEDKKNNATYWYQAVEVMPGGKQKKIYASEFGSDYEAIPASEQINALTGPVQTYRITGDQQILADAKATISTFNKFFQDRSQRGGYYTHIDPVTMTASAPSLGRNQSRKNYNSVGDHGPAYLFNLYLATGEKEYADFLETTYNAVAKYFPDFNDSPFVQERFNDDWSKDQQWGWQLNRAAVGNNLRIIWNLMRMNILRGKKEYTDLATRIAAMIPPVGSDTQRGGWYDVVERVLEPGQKYHRFVWNDRKGSWQQEQAILAYTILAGIIKKPEYRRMARESSAFYNAWFLNAQFGGVNFNVLADGQPYVPSIERGKISRTTNAGRPSFELPYLAAIYNNLLINRKPMDFYFRPTAGVLPGNVLRVAPDVLPAGTVRIGQVWINDKEYAKFDAAALTITLPATGGRLKVRVRLLPISVGFTAELISVTSGVATIGVAGTLNTNEVPALQAQIDAAAKQKATSLVIAADALVSISEEAIRLLANTKQKRGTRFEVTVIGANEVIREAIEASGFAGEIIVEGFTVSNA